MSESTVRESFEVLKRCSMNVKPGSEKWVHFTAMCMALGWVLDEPNYVNRTEELLRYLRDFVKGRVTG